MWRVFYFFSMGLFLWGSGHISPVTGISIQRRRHDNPKTFLRPTAIHSLQIVSKSNSPLSSSSELVTPTTDFPPELLFPNNEDPPGTTEPITMTTNLSSSNESLDMSPRSSESVDKFSVVGGPEKINFNQLTTLLRQKRKECRKSAPDADTYFLKSKTGQNPFTCEKLKLSSWLMDQLEKNSTEVFDSYVKLVRNGNISELTDEVDLLPESGPERLVFRLIKAFGEPVDKLLFYQFKKYTKTRELQVSIPHLLNLEIAPRTHSEMVTGRTLFDPGFNMKLKFPFFHDELKIAVATGPSFLAGLGVGIVVLGIKSIFAPLIFGLKAMIFSWFFKDMSPMDFVKTMAAPILPAWMSALRPEPEGHYSGWEQSVEHYEPPHVHNSYDSYGFGGHDRKNSGGLMGALSHLLPFTSSDQTNQFSHMNPMTQNNGRPYKSTRYTSPSTGYRPSTTYGEEEGRTQISRPNTMESDGSGIESNGGDEGNSQDSDFNFLPPTALQGDVDAFDPFYSPLLSRIDSIFSHLGFTEEGCKERAVCSIYKYPVKYAPYSNLLSAQLSKHQSELKRPVNTSPKILRYFKYMKAAKDGQAAMNCIELYPKCTNDTEKLTNLPMVKTFQQLTELMGATGPSG